MPTAAGRSRSGMNWARCYLNRRVVRFRRLPKARSPLAQLKMMLPMAPAFLGRCLRR